MRRQWCEHFYQGLRMVSQQQSTAFMVFFFVLLRKSKGDIIKNETGNDQPSLSTHTHVRTHARMHAHTRAMTNASQNHGGPLLWKAATPWSSGVCLAFLWWVRRRLSQETLSPPPPLVSPQWKTVLISCSVLFQPPRREEKRGKKASQPQMEWQVYKFSWNGQI